MNLGNLEPNVQLLRHLVFVPEVLRLLRSRELLRLLERPEFGRRAPQGDLEKTKSLAAGVDKTLVQRVAVRNVAHGGAERDYIVQHLRNGALGRKPERGELADIHSAGGEELEHLLLELGDAVRYDINTGADGEILRDVRLIQHHHKKAADVANEDIDPKTVEVL